jgi:membrane-anchored glycerophosphoryl diester phosphodiesterase (GDPDase)
MSQTPKTFGLVLNRFFQLAGSHWKTLVGVGLAPMAGILLVVFSWAGVILWKVTQLNDGGFNNPDWRFFLWLLVPVFPLYLLLMAVMAIYMAATARATTQINRGQATSVGEAWSFAFQRAGRYLWLMIRQFLVVTVPFVAIFTLIIGLPAALIALRGNSNVDNSAFTLLIPLIPVCYLCALVYVIWISIRLSFSYYASVTEDLGAARAMGRSWELTRGIFWKTFLVLLVIYALLYAVQMVVIIAFELVAMVAVVASIALNVQDHPAALISLISVGVLFLSAFFALLFSVSHAAYATALAILYEDQRVCQLGDKTAALGEPGGLQ